MLEEVEGPVVPAAAFGSGGGDGAAVGVSECGSPKPPSGATVERGKPVTAKAEEKKRKQKRRVTVDPMTMPFPVLTEEQLARIRDPVEREEWRELMARAAKHYYQSREELAALGYA
ncbi:unnamed protein product [Urochloa humidicola]